MDEPEPYTTYVDNETTAEGVYWRDVDGGRPERSFSVADLMDWMMANGVPVTARFDYPSCGSHGLGLILKVRPSDEAH